MLVRLLVMLVVADTVATLTTPLAAQLFLIRGISALTPTAAHRPDRWSPPWLSQLARLGPYASSDSP